MLLPQRRGTVKLDGKAHRLLSVVDEPTFLRKERSMKRFRFPTALVFLLATMIWSDRANVRAQDEVKKLPPFAAESPPEVSVKPGPQTQKSLPNHLMIDPETPLNELLPPPPSEQLLSGPVRTKDLSRVPEVRFQAPQEEPDVNTAVNRIAVQIAKINHLNNKKTDGFVEALRAARPDLQGLPFAMGDACRTKGERSKQFALAVALVRRALQTAGMPTLPEGKPGNTFSSPVNPTQAFATLQSGGMAQLVTVVQNFTSPPETFWAQYHKLCAEDDKARGSLRCEQKETILLARLAALTQILMPMAEMHPGFVKHLSALSHAEATRALARLAIFSGDAEVRKEALDALSVRRERDYTAILVEGLRYPWPAVAQRAAEALVKLERADLLPKLLDMLEKDDPRSPVEQEVKGKRVPVVRELVRVNHHRSCLMCHAPGNTGKVSPDAVSAEVPVPGQPLNSPSGPYNASRQEILVRVDVTYLRQDFSALQAVADANPWPEMQRFDFLVRERVLSDDEAANYRAKLKPRAEGEFSPYQRAALAALREMTGRDTEPTPQAWRRLLKLSAESQGKTKTP